MDARTQKILLVADSLTTTQRIAFLRAIEAQEPPQRLAVQVECDVERWGDEIYCAAVWRSAQPDLLVLSRCWQLASLNWIGLGRRHGVPVVYHIDDNLLDVPESLGPAKFAYYNDPERKAALRSLINASDLLYASTPWLEEMLARQQLKPPIHHGALSCSANAESIRQTLPATAPVIGYMATGGHAADLAAIAPAIAQVMDAVPLLQFETFGGVKPPEELARFAGRTRHFPSVRDYEAFLDELASLGWWVGIAPLEDTDFNRCKSDIKWLEYTLAGIPCVASDSIVYEKLQRTGAIRSATTVNDWREALTGLIENGVARAQLVERAQSVLQSEFGHQSMVEQIAEMIRIARSCLVGAD